MADVISQIKKQINIIFDVILTKHAGERQFRHEGLVITKQIIIDTLKCSLERITFDLMNNTLDVGNKIRVFNKTNNLNIILNIEMSKDDVYLRIVTIMIKPKFLDPPDTKKIYIVNCATEDYQKLKEEFDIVYSYVNRIDETFRRIRNQKLQIVKGKDCKKGFKKDSESGKCIKLDSQEKRNYSIQNKKNQLKARNKRATASKKRKKSMYLHNLYIGKPNELKNSLTTNYNPTKQEPYK